MSEEYRELLQKLEVESQITYDKAVMTLSGGALAISFAFVKDFTPIDGAQGIIILLTAWTLWGLSLAAVLTSHHLSALALRYAINTEDDETQEKTSNRYDTATAILNAVSGAFFVLDVICLVTFVYLNMENENVERKEPKTTTTGLAPPYQSRDSSA